MAEASSIFPSAPQIMPPIAQFVVLTLLNCPQFSLSSMPLPMAITQTASAPRHEFQQS